MQRVVYDAGALLAAERGSTQVWSMHRVWLGAGITPVVPAPVLVQAWRDGARQALLARLLKACEIRPLDEATARAAGQLCGRASTSDVTDAVVAIVVSGGPTVLVTSDPDDLAHLLAGLVVPARVELLTV